jgi:hypothetical protein
VWHTLCKQSFEQCQHIHTKIKLNNTCSYVNDMACWNNSDTHPLLLQRGKHWQQLECLPLYITQPMWFSWWERNATDLMAGGGFCVSFPNNMDVLPLWHVRYLSLHINGWLLLSNLSGEQHVSFELWAQAFGLQGGGGGHGLSTCITEPWVWTLNITNTKVSPCYHILQRHKDTCTLVHQQNFLNGKKFPSFSNPGVIRVTNFVIVNCLEK